MTLAVLAPAAKPIIRFSPSLERSAVNTLCRILSPVSRIREGAICDLSDPIARQAVIQTARREHIVPALYDAISSYPEAVARSERIPLAISLETNRNKNRQIGEAAVEIAAAAHRRSVEVVALKGAMWVLEDPAGCAAWRPMGDADLLVQRHNLVTMKEVLRELGYRPGRREVNWVGMRRFRTHYHLVEHRRGNERFVIEIHQDIGWRPELLPTELIFEHRRRIAPGLSLPCPWHAALYCLVHWQIHHYGHARGIGLNEGMEITRFLHRDDVEWDAVVTHARQLGIEQEIVAGIAFAATMFRSRFPNSLQTSVASTGDIDAAFHFRRSRAGTIAAKQRMRLARLRDCHRFFYGMNAHKISPAISRLLWRLLYAWRVPFMAFHFLSILALERVARARRP